MTQDEFEFEGKVDETLTDRVKTLENSLEEVNESYAGALQSLISLEQYGWGMYGNLAAEAGFTLGELKVASRELREWSDTNSLLKRGLEVRCSFMFSAGYKIDAGDKKISGRIQKLIDSDVNQSSVFSEEALTVNESARYTDSMLLLAFNKITNSFMRVPIWQIDDFVTNPENSEQVWYYKRSWSSEIIDAFGARRTELNNYWYVTDHAVAEGAPVVAQIQGIDVDPKYIMVDDHVNRKSGTSLGIPDSFTSSPWAIAYSNYLRDGTKVMASLAQWAVQIMPKSKRGGDAAGAKVRSTHGAGNVLISDMETKVLPTASAVDLGTGRPLAAQVAAGLGVDLVVLLADAGDTQSAGPIINSADPMSKTMGARQRKNSAFLVRCLKLLGVKDPCILWGKMTPDADFREQQTVIAAVGTGGFHTDEWRDRVAELAGITIKHKKPPKGYMTPNNKNSFNQIDATDPTWSAKGTDATPVAPAGSAAPAATSTVKTDGTTALTNGQGKKANTAKPSYGVNDLRGTGGRA